MGRLALDLRHALRTLRRNPGFAVVTILTIALGVGGSTAIFSFIRGILLRPLPYPEERRLVMVCETNLERVGDGCAASPGNLADWARRSRTIDAFGLARDWPFMILRDGKRESVAGGVVASSLFQVFGVRPERGRLLAADDSEPGREGVAVISHAFWRSRMGGAEDVIGRRLHVDTEDRTIVGVLPQGFEVPGLARAEMWIPIWSERKDWRWWRGFRPFGRLAPHVTLAQAQAEMESIRAGMEALDPNANRGWGVTLDSLRDRTVRSVRPALLVFLGAVAFVLLIACANVANLMLAQASSREKEFVLRAALGARPRRLVQQLLVESLVIALLGGGAGWVAAGWATDSLLALAPSDIPRLADVRMDGTVLAFSMVLTLATSVLFGIAPAWQASRPALHEALKEGRHTMEHHRGARARNLLVTAEVALAMILLIGAGLLLRSFVNLLDWSPGFDRSNLLVVQVLSSPGKYPKASQIGDLFTRMEEGLRTIPGVVSASAVSAVPLRGGDGDQEFAIEGRPQAPPGERPTASWFDMGPDYFRTLGIPLRRGRYFTDGDDETSPPVAIINETMARRHFPGQNPLGRRITLAAMQMTVEIVGVVADVRPFRPDAPTRPEIYWPIRQVPRWGTMFAVRGASDPAALARSVRARMLEIDPDIDVGSFTTMDQLAERELVRPRFNMLLLGVFSLLALLLACVGVYGVLSYSVEQRGHEIGVRLAFGARRSDVLRLVVTGGMTWALAGIALGIAGAIPLMLLLRHLLVDVSPGDPATFAGVGLLLALVAFIASCVPAFRATRVDPMVTLRGE
jgi:putative ABC transport system permease protein